MRLRIPRPTPQLREGAAFWLMLRIGRVPGHRARRELYRRLLGFEYPSSAVLYGGAEIRNPAGLRIGEHSIIGHGAVLDARAGLTIGRNVNLSSGVWIWTHQHDPQSPDFAEVGAPVEVRDHAWLSCRTVVLPGVTIGEGCVVAAGGVVTKDTPAWTIVGGVPAVVIGERPRVDYVLQGMLPIV